MRSIVWDLRHAFRTLAKSPGVVFVCVLSLGLGIGVNALLFMVLARIFVFAPTIAAADRFVAVEPGNSNQFSYLNYRDLQNSKIFEEAVGFRRIVLNVRSGDDFERANGLAVTANFFQETGVRAQFGRTFTAQEGVREAEPRVAVLSYGYWRRRFNSNPAVIGSSINLNNESFLILGVLSRTYSPVTGLESPDLYVPLSTLVLPNLDSRSNGNGLTVLARLHEGAGRERAQTDLTRLGQELERIHPDQNRGSGRPAKVLTLRQMMVRGGPGEIVDVSVILAALFAFVLLIACANVAGLLLARAAGRRREVAVRIALGVSRMRLIQTLLAESMLLAFAGAAAGLLLATWLTSSFTIVNVPGEAPLTVSLRPDLGVSIYGVVLALVTGCLCGIIPAVTATRVNIASEIQQAGTPAERGKWRLRHAFVVGQVAVSLTLIVVSALFLRSLQRIVGIDPGFDLNHGVVASIHLEPSRYSNEARLLLVERLLDGLKGVPGVRSVSFASFVPLAGPGSATRFQVEGRTGLGARTLLNWIGTHYFETLSIPLIEGRDFGPGDRAQAPRVVIVNQAFAEAYFPGETVIGKRITEGTGYAEIIGVVRDSSFTSFDKKPGPFLYYPFAQQPYGDPALHVHLRMAEASGPAISSVRHRIYEIDRTLAAEVSAIREAASFEIALRRFFSMLLGSLGVLGLFLAMIGLYGVMVHAVSARTTEIGIRMALGASSGDVFWAVLGNGFKLVGIGIAIGAGLSLALARPLAGFLAGVSPADPWAFGLTAVLLAAVGLCASYTPARRATRVDPMTALRRQ